MYLYQNETRFCPDVLWNNQFSLWREHPVVPICLHYTWFTWIPSAVMLFSVVYYCLFEKNLLLRNHANTAMSNLYLAKISVTGFLLMLYPVEYFSSQKDFDVFEMVSLQFPILRIICMLMLLCLIELCKRRCLIKSYPITIFWFLELFVSAIIVYSKINQQVYMGYQHIHSIVISFIIFLLTIAEFILFGMFVDIPVNYPLKSLEKTCSCISFLTFYWMNSFMKIGYLRALTFKDLYTLNQEDCVANMMRLFQLKWDNYCPKTSLGSETKGFKRVNVTINKNQKGPRVFKILFTLFGVQFFMFSLIKIGYDCLIFVQPIILRKLIQFTKSDDYMWIGVGYCLALFTIAEIQSMILQIHFNLSSKIGLRVRTSIVGMIYRKSLKLTSAARGKSTVGEVVNLMSVDAMKFQELAAYLTIIWSSPLQIFLAILMLYRILGVSVLAGVLVMILLIPINVFIAKIIKKLQASQMEHKDSRVKLMSEILNKIKVIKLYAWEKVFQSRVSDIREKELHVLKKSAYLNAGTSFVWSCAPFMVSLSTFGVYVLISDDNVLDAEKAFVSLALFNILRMPMNMLPLLVANIVQTLVALKRIQAFMDLDEINEDTIEKREQTDGNDVCIINGNFNWDVDSDHVILKNINLKIKEGSLVAIIGSVGSGKSSLLSAILGEMNDANAAKTPREVKGRGSVNKSSRTSSVKVDAKLRPGESIPLVVSNASNSTSQPTPATPLASIVVNKNKSIAYSSQQAWIQNATIMQNIKFQNTKSSSDHDKSSAYNTRYQDILNACCLVQDLKMFQAGDHTEIGEKGINISGGQKQRVSLARAVYADADIYLLDDPLSAVDFTVGRHIFHQVIGKRGLLKDKTRLLVTHNLCYLDHVDRVLILSDSGEIVADNTYQNLLADNKFQGLIKKIQSKTSQDLKMLNSSLISNSASNAVDTLPLDPKSVAANFDPPQPASTPSEPPEKRQSCHLDDKATEVEGRALDSQAEAERKGKLIEEEIDNTGMVKMTVVMSYLRAIGIYLSIFIVFMYTFANGSLILSNFWLSDWSEDSDIKSKNLEFLKYKINDSMLNDTYLSSNNTVEFIEILSTKYRLKIYALFGLIQGVGIYAASYCLAYAQVLASQNLHADLLSSTLRTPQSFFDSTPIGRIINRFAKDLDNIDTTVPMNLSMWIPCVFSLLSTLVVISISLPLFIVIIIPLGLAYYLIQRYFIATSRQLKRIESSSRSPIYSHFGETIEGVDIVRAFKMQQQFIDESNKRINDNNMCYYPSLMANRWLAIRLELLGNVVVLFSGMFAVYMRSEMSAGVVGLAISYSMNVTITLNWVVRMTSELEANIVSIERINEYIDIKPEAEWHTPTSATPPSHVQVHVGGGGAGGGGPLPADWPSQGAIKFVDYSMAYKPDGEPVLKNLTFNVAPKEKIGIVGRTGAGKSSLTLSLFRIVEALSGKITIDDIDISTIGLHDLRSKITIIPQDPVLFAGTLRMNLDLYSEYTDNNIWTALENVNMRSYFEKSPAGLSYICSEGGSNLSVGQRQLICMARALIRNSRVLVLDEATAAVDQQNDDVIQRTLKRRFADCTLLTIAHRLNTVLDYDRILVLDHGKVAEFDKPKRLLNNKKSKFYQMMHS